MEASSNDLAVVAIIPLYNGARWIAQSLQSILDQTVQPAEIVVVDDGSTDGGAGSAIVEELRKEHRQIKLLRKPNGGQSSARNFGVAHSKSPLIALLDQDDIWYPHHLERLVQPFRRKSGIPLGWVYSNLDTIDENGGSVNLGLIAKLPGEQPKRSLGVCLSQDMYVLPSASLISRTAFEAVGGFDERLCGYEDDDLFLRLFRAGYDNTYLRERLSKWRIHESSCGYSNRMAISRMIYARKLLATFPDEPWHDASWARDAIIPRFLRTTTNEYHRRLRLGDVTGNGRLLADIKELVEYLPTKPRLKLRFKVLGKWVKIRTSLPRHLVILALTRSRRCEIA